MNLKIEGATLLSVEEAKQIPEELRHFNGWWWLRSPGFITFCAAYVDNDGRVDKDGCSVNSRDDYVRPALQLNLESSNSINDGTKLKAGKYDFTVVCNGKYALCNTPIGKSVFHQNWDTNNANVYETSDIKKFVDRWFENEIKNPVIAKYTIDVHNAPANYKDYKYMVARFCDGELWYYGIYNEPEKAQNAYNEIDNGIILENEKER